MYECKECNLVFENHYLKANHDRWNHKDSTYTEAGKKNKSRKIKESINARFGNYINETVDCPKCQSPFQRKRRDTVIGLQKAKKFCSRPCANSRTWSKSDKLKKSAASKNSLLIKQRVLIICQQCGIKKEVIHSKKSQKFCSSACGHAFRKSISRETMDPKRAYRKDCAFKFGLTNYPEEFDFLLVKKHGWYSASNRGGNLNGVSRDHRYSVAEGFKNNIDPKLLAHPANCRLKRHNDNISKGSSCDISIEELQLLVEKWNLKYASN
jgi:hypothetical protein